MTRRQPPSGRVRPGLVAVLAGTVVLAGGVAGVVLSLDGGPPLPGTSQSPTADVTTTPPRTQTPAPSPTPTPEPAVFTILGAGDVLLHKAVTGSATTDGVTDYSAVLSGIDAWVQGADLALCHLETPVVPPGEEVSSYPLFGVPPQIVVDLREQGWDGCSTASNHSIDRGVNGLVATLDAFDAAGLGHVGTARSAVEAGEPQLYVLEREDRTLTVAHLSVTYGLNGLVLPADAPWAVTMLDPEATIQRATAARAAGADLVVVSVHDGTEYRTEPTQSQRAVTQALAASGVVDLVLGHHAHVPQPIEHLAGGPEGSGMWVAFGLGNLVSNQSADCCSVASTNGLMVTATSLPSRAFLRGSPTWSGRGSRSTARPGTVSGPCPRRSPIRAPAASRRRSWQHATSGSGRRSALRRRSGRRRRRRRVSRRPWCRAPAERLHAA